MIFSLKFVVSSISFSFSFGLRFGRVVSDDSADCESDCEFGRCSVAILIINGHVSNSFGEENVRDSIDKSSKDNSLVDEHIKRLESFFSKLRILDPD